jgi:hypothetical protein
LLKFCLHNYQVCQVNLSGGAVNVGIALAGVSASVAVTVSLGHVAGFTGRTLTVIAAGDSGI